MMVVDIGTANSEELTTPRFTQCQKELRRGDLVRTTNAVNDASGFGGSIVAAVRAGTVGVVESAAGSAPVVRFTGYFDHALGLPMVMERRHRDLWASRRKLSGPVQRILPSGLLSGPEASHVLMMGDSSLPQEAASTASTPLAAAAHVVRNLRDEVSADVPALAVPVESLERSDGVAWQPMGEATALRRQAMAPMHVASLPFLRRVSQARLSSETPLVGWGHGERFLQPGADSSMVHDATVLAYDGPSLGRQFNLLYIDEEADYAVVGMGSASGALYSANISVRQLSLSDIYLPFSKLISYSQPLGTLLKGSLSETLEELYGASSHSFPNHTAPHFQYRGTPLPPGDVSLFATLRGLFGGRRVDGAESTGGAWKRLITELREWHGGSHEALQREIAEAGTIKLPLELFSVRVASQDVPVYLDVVHE